MSRSADRVLAVVIIAGFLVLTVCLCDISIETFPAAGTFQDTGQDMCVCGIMDFLPLESVEFSLLLC